MLIGNTVRPSQIDGFSRLIGDELKFHIPYYEHLNTTIAQDSLDISWHDLGLVSAFGGDGVAIVLDMDYDMLDDFIDLCYDLYEEDFEQYIHSNASDSELLPMTYLMYRIHDYDQLPPIFDPMPKEADIMDFSIRDHRHLDETLPANQTHYDDLYEELEPLTDILIEASFQYYFETGDVVFGNPDEDEFLWYRCNWFMQRYTGNIQIQHVPQPVSLQPQQINALLSHPSPSAFIGDGECCICLNNFTFPQQLPCQHVFCDACIRQHLALENRCPLCRAFY